MASEFSVPPTIEMLLAEPFPLADKVASRKQLRAMMPDLKAQAQMALDGYDTSQSSKESLVEFHAYPDAGLDLFLGMGACQDIGCRLHYVDRFSRSFGLLADRAFLTDTISSDILTSGRSTNAVLDNLLDDIAILKKISPLIDAGVVRFRSGSQAFCKSCYAEFEEQVQIITTKIFDESRDNIEVSIEASGLVSIETGDLYDPPLVLGSRRPVEDFSAKGIEDFVRGALARQVRGSMFCANSAALGNGTVFSNSKLGIWSLLEAEKRVRAGREMARWAADASAQLPWVSDLSVSEIVILRNEASKALPRLREVMSRHLGAQSIDSIEKNPGNNLREVIQELREDAAEVEAELKGIKSRQGRHFNKLYNVLALSIFAYSALDGKVAEGLMGLATALGLLHQFEKDESKHEASLKIRPGYVLVQAKELLAHAQ